MADPILRVRDNDGKVTEIYSYKGDPGKDGVSITNAYINNDNELMLELSDGQPINLGVVVGADGYTPVKGTDYNDGVGIENILQTKTGIGDGDDNVVVITLTNNLSKSFTIKNGTKGDKGDKGDNGVGIRKIRYDDKNEVWEIIYDNGDIEEVDGPIIPQSVTDLSDGKDYYTSNEIDQMFGSYVDDVYHLLTGE